jgi:hypothetical protein
MKRRLLAAMSTIPLVCLAGSAREESAAALFNEYCLAKTSDFAALSARANAEHLQVELDREIPLPDGKAMRQKHWLIPSFGKAPMMLTSTDGENGALHVFGCGIYVPDARGEAMEAALSQLSRMAEPVRRNPKDGAGAVTWWQARVGDTPASEKSEVMLSSGIPGIPGAGVNLILKRNGSDAP